MLDAAELRRASATDAAAVQQYLRTIDSDELNALLDAFTDAESKKKDDGDAHEWLALVNVLLRTSETRQRTATRILQSLWRGNASEMEALRWVSEISLGYMASVATSRERGSGVAQELRVVLQVALQFVRDAMAGDGVSHAKKTLPQLLALVPVLLSLLGEALAGHDPRGDAIGGSHSAETDACEQPSSAAVHEYVVQLLELPWDPRSVPHLLELLREHTSLVSRDGWRQLRQSVQHLVAPQLAGELPSDSLNPLLRECLLLAAARAGGADVDAAAWVELARFLLRRLPTHLRQEAEFNVQMSLHQFPSLASLICDAVTATPTPLVAGTDASDVVMLLHAIRASKPLLHHHLVGSTFRTTAADSNSVFSRAEHLIRNSFLQAEPAAAAPAGTATDDGKPLRQAVSTVLEFGGRQLHARVWKAQLLHEMARFWAETHAGAAVAERASIGSLVMESIFNVVPEVREEVLQGLLESARVPAHSERSLQQLRCIVKHHTRLVVPHRQLLEDWLGSLASAAPSPHQSATLSASFHAVAPLVVVLKDFYNFAMVFLRKQMSSPHPADRELAIDVWCSWLESGLGFDAQQEEEIVLAVKHAVQLSSSDTLWMFERLQRLLAHDDGHTDAGSRVHRAFRPASLVEFHSFFASTLRDFIESVDGAAHDSIALDSDVDSEDDDAMLAGDQDLHHHDRPLGRVRRFRVSRLDAFVSQNSSVASALQLGMLFESVVACLVGTERLASSSSLRDAAVGAAAIVEPTLGRDMLRWLDVFVHHRDEFFHWVCSGSAAGTSSNDGPPQIRVGDKRFVWGLAARVSLGCAFCSLSMRRAARRLAGLVPVLVWELLEFQLALARLWRKFCAATPMVDAAALSAKEHFDVRLVQAAASTLRPLLEPLFSDMVGRLGGAQDGVSNSGGGGASLDGMLFVLDVYTHSISSRTAAAASGATDLPSLLAIYSVVIASCTTHGGGTDAPLAAFTTYGESLASHFPPSMRHLVLPDTATSLAVSLDARAAEELLSRVCSAIAKSVDALHACGPSPDGESPPVHAAWSAFVSGIATSDDGAVLARAASRLLTDVGAVMNDDAFAKFRPACVALARRLVELLPKPSGSAAAATIAATAFDLLCDNVVHQMPVLRGLLALSLSVSGDEWPSAGGDALSAVVDRAAAVLEVCGFHGAAVAASTLTEGTEAPTKAETNTKKNAETKATAETENVRVRRRRLRQVSDDDGDDDDEPADSGGRGAANRNDGGTPTPVLRAPRLVSAASQAAALLASLALLESVHSRSMQRMVQAAKQATAKAKPIAKHARSVRIRWRGLVQCVARVHALLSSTVLVSADASWVNARTLAKLLSVADGAVRVGRLCCATAAGSWDSGDATDSDERASLVDAFQSCVGVTVRGRAWLRLVRYATTDPATKTKLSSTILKLDIFLLDAPTLVATLLKADGVRVDTKRRLRVFLSSVESDLAQSSTATTTAPSLASDARGPPATKRHLVGVVPIVPKKRRKRLRSRHPFIDSCLAEEDGDDAFADLEDFIA